MASSKDHPRPWRGDIAIAGLMSTAAVVALTAVAHLAVYRFPFPPEAIAQNAVGATSGGFDSFFIERLGHWAQRLAVVGISIAFAVSGAFIAQLLPRSLFSRLWAWAGFLLPLWLVTVAVYSAPPPFIGRWAFAAASLPAFIIGGLVGARTLGPIAANRRDGTTSQTDKPTNPHLPRRSFLTALGVGGAGVVVGSSGLATLIAGGSDTGVRKLQVARVVRARVPTPAPGDAAFAHIPGLTKEVTPTGDFYVVDKDILNPVLSLSSWRLKVHGLVDNRLSLGYEGLRAMGAVERYQTLECISNKVGGQLMSTALWTGIPLRAILGRAGVRSTARTVVFRSAGGYSESHPIEKALDSTSLIAIGMNGHELPRQHGFPARLLTVGTYGMKNPKWLTDIELVDSDYRGYWEVRGWSPDVDPKITARIDVPTDGATVGSEIVIAGVAFAGDRGISRVQVSTDGGGSWRDAMLKTALSPYTWRMWMFTWQPPSGARHHILARAFDGSGVVQTDASVPPFPSGAAGLEGISVSS